MKKKLLILFLFFISFTYLNAKQSMSLLLLNSGDKCDWETRIWLIDANSDNIYDILFYDGCNNKPVAYSLLINSANEVNENETATLTQGSIEAKNFIIMIFNPDNAKYTHKLYYDNQTSKAILEDYTDNGNEPTTYEEADNYFYTQILGSLILITKKTDINVQSVMLCSLDGKIITQLQNVEGWGQFVFDLSRQPSGMYLIRFIATDRALTKKIVYVR